MIHHHRPVAEVYFAKIAVKAPSCLPVWQLEEFVEMEWLEISWFKDSKWCCSLLQFRDIPQFVCDIFAISCYAISSFRALCAAVFRIWKMMGLECMVCPEDDEHVDKTIISNRKRGWCIALPPLKGRSSQTLLKAIGSWAWISVLRGGSRTFPKLWSTKQLLQSKRKK